MSYVFQGEGSSDGSDSGGITQNSSFNQNSSGGTMNFVYNGASGNNGIDTYGNTPQNGSNRQVMSYSFNNSATQQAGNDGRVYGNRSSRGGGSRRGGRRGSSSSGPVMNYNGPGGTFGHRGRGGCGPGGCPGNRNPWFGDGPGSGRGSSGNSPVTGNPEWFTSDPLAGLLGGGGRRDEQDRDGNRTNPGNNNNNNNNNNPPNSPGQPPPRGPVDGTAEGKETPFRNIRTTDNDKGVNIHLNIASGSGSRPGYMDVPGRGARTEFGKAMAKALRNSKSVLEAIKKIAGKTICIDQKPLYVKADKVGGQELENSRFNISEQNKNDGKTFFVGISGWGPQKTFYDTTKDMAKLFKDKFNAVTKVAKNGSIQHVKKYFKQIADYAKKHPNQVIRLALYNPSHGNNYGPGAKNPNAEGRGRGSTLNYDEKQLADALKMFAGLKNVGITLMHDCCYAGGFLDFDQRIV